MRCRRWPLLPSATVFLLLCNDQAVLGLWVDGRWLDVFTGAAIAALVMLSIALTASVLYPGIGETAIPSVLRGYFAMAGGLVLWRIVEFAISVG